MSIKNCIKKLFGENNAEQETMEYCKANGFRHGKNFYWHGGYPIDAGWPWLITVGDDVTFSSNVRILAHDASTVKCGAHTKIGIVNMGNNVFIGANSVVLCNTRIGDNVIIGAGSVVTRDIPSNSVYAGNPAKFICSYEEFQNRHIKNRETHPIFDNRNWDDWRNATEEEKAEMREKLKDTYGYL